MIEYKTNKKIDWYSSECFICLDIFSQTNPRIFAYNCKHSICINCLNLVKDRTDCTVCKSTVNPIMYNIKNFKVYKLDDENTSFVYVGNSVNKLPNDKDILQSVLINGNGNTNEKKSKHKSCCCIL